MGDDLIPTAAGIAWGTVGALYAAACVWICVRLFNRRERWSKWTALGLAMAPLVYLLSSGPLSMVAFRSRVVHTPTVMPDGSTAVTATSETGVSRWFPIAYAPLFWASEQAQSDVVFSYWMLFPHSRTLAEP
jgi:hypothetical protein